MAGMASKAFFKTLTRVEGLVALHPSVRGTPGPGRPEQHVSDVLRGALVLAMAALDALVVDSVSEAIPQLSKKGALGPTVAKWAKDQPEKVVACFAEADPSKALAQLCREALGPQTFQRSAAIEGVLREVLGSEGPWEKAAELLSASGEKWSAGEVAQYLDTYVERRNRIVHGGDLKPGGTATNPIRLDFVQSAVRVVKAVGEAVSWVVTRRLRSA